MPAPALWKPLALLVTGGALAFAACGGTTGSPAAPYALPPASLDATAGDVGSAQVVQVSGRVVFTGSDAGVPGAFVLGEVGGLLSVSQAGADGGAVASLSVDTAIDVGAVTDDAGAFSLSMPAGAVGLHVLSAPAFERRSVASTDAGPLVVAVDPLPSADADPVQRPALDALDVSVTTPLPGQEVTFAVHAAAGLAADPLSDEIFLLEPTTQFASPLVPPSPSVPGAPYPDGVYNCLVRVPTVPGRYTYTAVAASIAGVASPPSSVTVTVSPNGFTPDGGSGDAEIFLDGAGLPDGRR